MTPDYLITADGTNITGKAKSRLIELRVIDEEGFNADRFELALDDRDEQIAMPAPGAEVKIAVGYQGAPLTPLGTYTVDTISGEGPLLSMRIGGKAADMAGPIRSPRTRAWEDVTLGDIVDRIAAEAGLRAAVGESIRGTHWGYIAQTAESNLHFLTRLARDLDAIAKPAGGRLMVVKRGEGKNAEGADLPEAQLTTADLSSYHWKRGEREEYACVEAEWQETAAGKTRRVTAGSGTPKKTLRHIYASQPEAERAAKAHLAMAERGAMELTGKLARFQPALLAGGQVTVDGLRAGLEGSWLATQVTHLIFREGLTTEFRAIKAAPEGTG